MPIYIPVEEMFPRTCELMNSTGSLPPAPMPVLWRDEDGGVMGVLWRTNRPESPPFVIDESEIPY